MIPRCRLALILGCLVMVVGCPSPYQLGFPGPYPTKAYLTMFGEGLPITVFYPAADPPMRNLPVVIFDTGFNQPRVQYEGFATQLAQWGYVAVIRAYPSLGFAGFGDALIGTHVEQSRQLIDWLAGENRRPDSPLYGMVDSERVGTTGHSLGATVAICTGLAEPRVRAVVSLDVSYNGGDFDVIDVLPQCPAALMYIAGDSGGWCARAPGATARLIDYTSPPGIEVTIKGADHMDFMDTPVALDYLGFVACPNGPANNQEVRNIASRYMISWFNVYLKGNVEFEDYFNGARARDDQNDGLVSFVRKLEPLEPQ